MLKEIHEQADAVAETIADRTVRADGVDLGRGDARRATAAQRRRASSSSPAARRYHAGLIGRYAIEEWARLPGRDGHRLRVPLPQPGRRPRRPRHRHHAVGRDRRHAGGDAPRARARRDGARGDERHGLAGHARRRRRALHARRARDRRRGDEDVRLPGRGRCTCWRCASPSCAARSPPSARRSSSRDLKHLPHCIDGAARAPRRAGRARRRAPLRATTSSSTSAATSGLPVALEGALKLKEISYIATDAYAAGEMKHGPIALLDERTPVVCVATDSPVLEKVVSNMQEVRARGAHVIADRHRGQRRASASTPRRSSASRATDWMLQPLLAVIPLQLLAYCDRPPARAERRPAAQPGQDRHGRVARSVAPCAACASGSTCWRSSGSSRRSSAGPGWPSGCSPTASAPTPRARRARRSTSPRASARRRRWPRRCAWRRGAGRTSRSSARPTGIGIALHGALAELGVRGRRSRSRTRAATAGAVARRPR